MKNIIAIAFLLLFSFQSASAAIDHNSTRSNRANIISFTGGGGFFNAIDHNSTRSNRANAVSPDLISEISGLTELPLAVVADVVDAWVTEVFDGVQAAGDSKPFSSEIGAFGSNGRFFPGEALALAVFDRFIEDYFTLMGKSAADVVRATLAAAPEGSKREFIVGAYFDTAANFAQFSRKILTSVDPIYLVSSQNVDRNKYTEYLFASHQHMSDQVSKAYGFKAGAKLSGSVNAFVDNLITTTEEIVVGFKYSETGLGDKERSRLAKRAQSDAFYVDVVLAALPQAMANILNRGDDVALGKIGVVSLSTSCK